MTTLLTNVDVGEMLVTEPGNVTFGNAENVTVAGCPTFTFTASDSAMPTLTAKLDMSVKVMNPLELELPLLPVDEEPVDALPVDPQVIMQQQISEPGKIDQLICRLRADH